jgi:hypothetical protein
VFTWLVGWFRRLLISFVVGMEILFVLFVLTSVPI